MKAVVAAIAVLALPAAAGSAEAPLTGVTVTPPVICLQPRRPPSPDVPAPKVVSTFPAKGAVVRPGRLVLRITFDLPMACDGTFLDAPQLKSPLSWGDRVVKLTRDRKTFRIEGRVEKNSAYGLRLNHAPTRDFVGLSGQPLEPFDLDFTTSSGPEVVTIKEALAQDVEAGR